MANLTDGLKIWLSYFRLHYRASLAYRKSFWLQIVGMFLNNTAFVMIWVVFFKTFPDSLASHGITPPHAFLLFALMSSSYGCVSLLCGGAFTLSDQIVQNRLDTILILPRHPYFLTLLSKSYVSGWGDFAFGLILFMVSQRITVVGCGLFIFFTVTSCAVLTATIMILQSLSFFMGNSEQVHRLGTMGMITFGAYPEEIFSNAARFCMYTVLPVGIYIYLPVKTLLHPSLFLFASVLASSVFVVLLSIKVFNAGLCRYESGNQMVALK